MDHKCVTKKRNSGFSLVEVLAAVAILVILLGVGGAAAAYYRDYLKITELDNAAREIYMAAENRAVLLSGSRSLSSLLDKDQPVELPEEYFSGSGESTLAALEPLAEGGEDPSEANPSGYYIKRTNCENLDELLPVGTIDPALRDAGDFYIVYEPISGCVTDVFYAEQPDALPVDINDAFAIAGNRDARMRRSEGMLGYYGGGMADAMEEREQLEYPNVKVLIDNDERLTVSVTFTIPQQARDMNATVTPAVTLKYEGIGDVDLLKLPEKRLLSQSGDFDKDLTITYSWVLDSLEEGLHFKELFSGSPSGGFGKAFTVTASVRLSANGARDSYFEHFDEDNSLFAEDSPENTAEIRKLRHLQNLDTGTSGAGAGITSAVQAASIDDCGVYLGGDYIFTPIQNDGLIKYESLPADGGSTHYLRELKVTENTSKDRDGAGLFAVSPSESVKGVRLINATVVGGSKPAGTLAGVSNGTAFENCQVYWETGANDYEILLGSTEGDNTDSLYYNNRTGNDYPKGVIGGTAGGLAGEVTGGSFTKCLAATLVKGETAAGGLMGSATGTVSVTTSYADCYIRSASSAAGLIGSASGTTSLNNVYAAGFIDGENTASVGGILTGSTASGSGVYSAMCYMRQKGTSEFGVNGERCFYLADADDGAARSYAAMTNAGNGTEPSFAATLNGAGGSAFEFKTRPDSHPYNIYKRLSLQKYSFPGLKELPHYGDWGAQFKEPSLVYFEKYKYGGSMPAGASEYAFSGGNANYLEQLKKDTMGQLEEQDIEIRLDGYAVAFLENDIRASGSQSSELPSKVTITYTYMNENNSEVTCGPKDYTVPEAGAANEWKDGRLIRTVWNGQTYLLAPLPEAWVTGKLLNGEQSFFQYLKFELMRPSETTGGENKKIAEGESFYNPHFAETVIPYSKEDLPAGIGFEAYPDYLMRNVTGGEVSVRTPRQLYNLSEFEVYYHDNDTKPYHYIFQQTMDLDYSTYDWTYYRAFTSDVTTQKPIGRGGNKEFSRTSTYDGGCLFIKNVYFQPDLSEYPAYAGLFGQTAGTLRDIVYLMSTEQKPLENVSLARDYLYMGALAGRNTGTVENCAVMDVRMSADAYSSSSLYMGGLVGSNEGTIENCAAEAASLFASATSSSHVCAAGFAGRNSGVGQISNSYAVGRVSTDGADLTTALACGFVGENTKTAGISGSYSAMDLETNHSGGQVHGFSGSTAGRLANVRYLNEGNFSYLENAFNAKYSDEGAKPVKYTSLNGNEEEGAALFGGMETGGKVWTSDGPSGEETYIYPTAVTDRNGSAAHYGSFPRPLEMGEMGVYYWEKLEQNGGYSYNISLLAVDPIKKTVTKQSTLITSHDDGGVVVDYGYGYYNKAQRDLDSFKSSGIAYMGFNGEYGKERAFAAEVGKTNIDTNKAVRSDGYDADGNPIGVNRELAELSRDSREFDFHSYHTFSQGQKKDEGLYLASTFDDSRNGTFTLTQSGTTTADGTKTSEVEITFSLNPFFADSLAVKEVREGGVLQSLTGETGGAAGTGGWRLLRGAAQTEPGHTEKNSYSIRSIDQLEFINWNASEHNCRTVLRSNTYKQVVENARLVREEDKTATNAAEFPYLSSSGNTTEFYWVQSHDIKGGENVVYTPIAEYYDTSLTKDNQGYLDGWFGGSFDGQSYVIENVDVQGQTASCAGLFGAVYNGTLRNIILYSSTGDSYVQSGYAPSEIRIDDYYDLEARENKKWYQVISGSESQWCAVGALAGLAASNGGNAVENCAVSGYTIRSKTYTPRFNPAFGGVGAGGLLGISNMSLKNCTADTTVRIMNGTVSFDNMRIGGLVGTCQGSITNCYAGGEIVIDQQPDDPDAERDINKKINIGAFDGNGKKGIYVGGLVGGSYMKPLLVGDGTQYKIGDAGNNTDNVLTSCYSYVKLPKMDAHDSLAGLYMIGGTGEINDPKYTGDAANHGVCTITNCYYLESEVLANNPVKDGTGYDKAGIYTKFSTSKDFSRYGVKTDLPGNTTVTGSGSSGGGTGSTGGDLSFGDVVELSNPRPVTGWGGVTVYVNDESLSWGEVRKLYLDGAGSNYSVGMKVYYMEDNNTYTFYGTIAKVGTNILGWVDKVYITLADPGSEPAPDPDPDPGTETEIPSGIPLLTEYSHPFELTYRQLADKDGIPVQTNGAEKLYFIYQLLNGKLVESGGRTTVTPAANDASTWGENSYHPVTTMKGDFSVAGKYSYPPAARSDLAGLDYPFPTILTREGANIHYGGWPTHGIERYEYPANPGDPLVSLGGRPIELDLFAVPKGGYKELLKLTSDVPEPKPNTTGEWSVRFKLSDDELAELTDEEKAARGVDADGCVAFDESSPSKYGVYAKVDPNGREATLSVTGYEKNTYTIKIAYTVNGIEYRQFVDVPVTSELHMYPHTVTLFPDDAASVALKPVDKSDNDLAGALALTGAVSADDAAGWLTADVAKAEEGTAEADRLKLTAANAKPGISTTVDVEYEYTPDEEHPDQKYPDTDRIRANVSKLPDVVFNEPVKNEEKYVCTAEINFAELFESAEDGTKTPLVTSLTDAVRIEPAEDGNPPTVAFDSSTKTVTITYAAMEAPAEITDPDNLEALRKALLTQLPEIKLSITLTTGGGEDGTGGGAVTHQVTMSVKYKEPEAGAEGGESGIEQARLEAEELAMALAAQAQMLITSEAGAQAEAEAQARDETETETEEELKSEDGSGTETEEAPRSEDGSGAGTGTEPEPGTEAEPPPEGGTADGAETLPGEAAGTMAESMFRTVAESMAEVVSEAVAEIAPEAADPDAPETAR